MVVPVSGQIDEIGFHFWRGSFALNGAKSILH